MNIEGEIFNVGSGKAIALRGLAEKIWKIAGADLALLKIGARPTKESELHNTEADVSKIRALDSAKKQTGIGKVFNHFAGDDNVEGFIQFQLFKLFQITPMQIFLARFRQNIESSLVKIETVQLARYLFQLKMQKHIVFD